MHIIRYLHVLWILKLNGKEQKEKKFLQISAESHKISRKDRAWLRLSWLSQGFLLGAKGMMK